MENSVYINLWKKLNENFMTAPKDSGGNPQPSFLQFLTLVYSTPFNTTKEMVKTIAKENRE